MKSVEWLPTNKQKHKTKYLKKLSNMRKTVLPLILCEIVWYFCFSDIFESGKSRFHLSWGYVQCLLKMKCLHMSIQIIYKVVISNCLD